jgi:N-acetylmuramoyl-L-alanine amidase
VRRSGHNGLNHTDPAYLDRQIWNGREWEDCNTTGTQTASGTTVPKVLIECGNMANPADAALLTTPRVQRGIARALDAAIVRFLTGRR